MIEVREGDWPTTLLVEWILNAADKSADYAAALRHLSRSVIRRWEGSDRVFWDGESVKVGMVRVTPGDHTLAIGSPGKQATYSVRGIARSSE